MEERLESVLKKIIKLCAQEPSFALELLKELNITPQPTLDISYKRVSNDVTAIREALEIRANTSITYDFISDTRLRDQLIIDNLRMENAALNLVRTESERFYDFCVNAFYQIENVINYYFHKTYPQINDLTTVIQTFTANEKSEDGKRNFSFKSNGKEHNVSDIAIYHKINAFCNSLQLNIGDNYYKLRLSNLRKVRNEGEHRCTIIMKEKDEKNKLYNFFKCNSFNSVRRDLIKLVNAVKENIGKPIPLSISKQAIISSILPSACYVKYDGENHQLPFCLFSKVQGRNQGDSITIQVNNSGTILDVILNDAQ